MLSPSLLLKLIDLQQLITLSHISFSLYHFDSEIHIQNQINKYSRSRVCEERKKGGEKENVFDNDLLSQQKL